VADRISKDQCGIKARDRGPQIKAISIAAISIACTFYAVRIGTRMILKVGTLGLDDLFITLSTVCSPSPFNKTKLIVNSQIAISLGFTSTLQSEHLFASTAIPLFANFVVSVINAGLGKDIWIADVDKFDDLLKVSLQICTSCTSQPVG
jgi:hypothetical protein